MKFYAPVITCYLYLTAYFSTTSKEKKHQLVEYNLGYTAQQQSGDRQAATCNELRSTHHHEHAEV